MHCITCMSKQIFIHASYIEKETVWCMLTSRTMVRYVQTDQSLCCLCNIIGSFRNYKGNYEVPNQNGLRSLGVMNFLILFMFTDTIL